ncbi:head-tail connector protein [Sphingomonas adhaesiva]|uniref:head-tail connector protein n=1 Tax=Sphingomonas adhaesiva TaxID=28212 RepID=UPI002FF6D55E
MAEPVTLAEAKAHLRLDAGVTDEDPGLTALIVAARRAVEIRTRRTIVGETPTLTGDDLAMARHAILLLIGAWYANREGATTEARSAPAEVPLSVSWLLDPLVRWDDGA